MTIRLHREQQISKSSSLIAGTLATVNNIVVGKPDTVKLALCCLLAKGHLLIEDIPGVGKTTLAQVLARTLGLEFNRIQFTSDLLPADILGVSIYHQPSSRFEFHPGPVFSSVVLADEINRATPKAQSALLEAMAENQVSVDGKTYELPRPFFVIATQNPDEQIGTFPLPESQLDRFFMKISIGYPDRKSERLLLDGQDIQTKIHGVQPVMQADQLLTIQNLIPEIRASAALLDYIQDIIHATRENNALKMGLSPRAGIALLNAARAWAYIENRDIVLPEDVQAVAPAIMGHRLNPADTSLQLTRQELASNILATVAVQ